MFKRLHNNEKYKGTGIGLALCKKLVDNIDGQIWLESPKNGGSIFHFQLPFKTSAN